MINNDLINSIYPYLANELDKLSLEDKVDTLNALRIEIHQFSPFKNEPVDCIQWVKVDSLQANDYNPNVVAPPEMRLLEVSISEDGYTQPIVSWEHDNYFEVVDGFHRTRVGKESKAVKERIQGYLPVTIINSDHSDKGDRIASTIRHNRARGKHTVSGMSDIVLELKNRNWSNERIAKKLGLDEDEILRLCQITGLASLFTDQEFSKSWDIQDSEPDFVPLDDEDISETEEDKFRTINTNDPQRIFHKYNEWECYKAGFYSTTPPKGMNRTQCEESYRDFLSDTTRFQNALEHIIVEWKNSCEHYLTNTAMNRIAWLGQAAMCYATGIPAMFRSGFSLLTKQQQDEANQTALTYLNKWLVANNRQEVSMSDALSDNQSELY
jgi:ParB-like chromosome segregation protein Spo0J